MNRFHFFIAGIMQGSRQDLAVYDQSYRMVIQEILKTGFPESLVYCPAENHPDSPAYEDEKAKQVFMRHIEMVKASHGLVVYLPEASLGSAIEMWEAHRSGVFVIAITPMRSNWVVRICSDQVCGDTDAFRRFVDSGTMRRMMENRFSAPLK